MKNRKEAGFTLIELLVVITVIAVLTSILILYSRTSEQQLALFREQARMVSTILRVKSLTLQTFKGNEPVCGYGVHFDVGNNKYLIFKEDKVSGSCSSGNKAYDFSTGCSGECLEVIDLAGSGIILSSGGTQISDVFFQPPDPKVFLTPDPGSQAEVTVTLSRQDGQGSLGVLISKVGQVSTQ